ncbi:hypothetical protein [Phytoactinopolyspora endophytica]|uniref:hypothetical protein n=1 Tax=Phytoactinopolyspora endophytica TaxID=1642495 RepID=UPI00101B7356|nr:hypothetical protein [Phytoactinopolyspora endophytica]
MSEPDVQPDVTPAPDADADEQRRPVVDENSPNGQNESDPEEPDLPSADLPRDLPSDVDPADAYEQTRVVEHDEDDYR